MGDRIVAAGGEAAYWPAATASLDDFRPLLPAEEEVVARLHSGDFDRLGDGSRPELDDPARAIRAPFLRFLLLGGDEGCRPHEKGIRLTGAWIRGTLDLEACRIFRDIGLKDCRFDAAPILRSAIIDRLFLDGSSLPGFLCGASRDPRRDLLARSSYQWGDETHQFAPGRQPRM